MRKTNDEEILKMLKEGKTQKEIATHFGVSPAAICKRVKRLLPPPASLEQLTPKEQRFCLEKAKGQTATDSALKSFDVTSRESAKVIGSQLMKKDNVQTAIKDLMEFHGLTGSYRILKLKGHVDNRDPSVSLKALDMSFKLDSSYPPTKSVNMNAEVKLVGNIRELDQFRGVTPDEED
jgi:hypothetical protein